MKVLMETSSTQIPERLQEIDASLLLFYNTEKQCGKCLMGKSCPEYKTKKGCYDVCSVDLGGTTYRIRSFPYCDARILPQIRYCFWVARNTGDPYKQLINDMDTEEYLDDKAYEKHWDSELPYRAGDRIKWMGGQWRGHSCSH